MSFNLTLKITLLAAVVAVTSSASYYLIRQAQPEYPEQEIPEQNEGVADAPREEPSEAISTDDTPETPSQPPSSASAPAPPPAVEAMTPPPPVAPQENLAVIELQYKADAEDAEEMMEVTLTAINNNPDVVCSAIVANRTTRQHTYFLFLDELAKLHVKYDQYRDRIAHIDQNLNLKDNGRQIAIDWCLAAGFSIPA